MEKYKKYVNFCIDDYGNKDQHIKYPTIINYKLFIKLIFIL